MVTWDIDLRIRQTQEFQKLVLIGGKLMVQGKNGYTQAQVQQEQLVPVLRISPLSDITVEHQDHLIVFQGPHIILKPLMLSQESWRSRKGIGGR